MLRPLAGFRILDLSRVLAGPFATQLLADLGAEVIKVEPPTGDPTRTWGPPFDRGESAYFRSANRGKKTRVLDLHDAAHQLHLEELLTRADVVVENLTPENAERVNLAWDALHARHPKLILASVRGYASDVPASRRAACDCTLQAEAGWMSLTGEPEGLPVKTGTPIVDVVAALYLANGIQSALMHRERTGMAIHVEVPLMEAALASLVHVAIGTLMTGLPPDRMGNTHPNLVPYQAFQVADGEVFLCVATDRQFEILAMWLGLDLEKTPQWRTNTGRQRDRAALVAAMEAQLLPRTKDDVLGFCLIHAIPTGQVRVLDDVLFRQAGQLHHLIQPLLDPATGAIVPLLASPLLLNDQRACSPLPPPHWPS